MARTIKLNNGVTLEDANIGQTPVNIWIYCQGLTMSEAYALFSDPDATDRISWDMYGEGEPLIYEGYTDLVSLSVTGDSVSAALQRPPEEE